LLFRDRRINIEQRNKQTNKKNFPNSKRALLKLLHNVIVTTTEEIKNYSCVKLEIMKREDESHKLLSARGTSAKMAANGI